MKAVTDNDATMALPPAQTQDGLLQSGQDWPLDMRVASGQSYQAPASKYRSG